MALDLGSLNAGEDVYYYVDGKNVGGSIFSSKEFDILFMTKQNYDLYANGSSATMLSSGTKYEENGLIPAIANITVAQRIITCLFSTLPTAQTRIVLMKMVTGFGNLSSSRKAAQFQSLQAQDNQYEEPMLPGND